ncbi:protein kinase C-binding protein NELL1 [Salmo salar]|uniref:Protein kinase C-binding protein NELL1 n=1 Tax=Salmo salar TaxID=8030 RepID=A0A1S3KSP0_SALSA|nr:protein kinase C-binding protein NELL1 [Salmo salar]|eukprot:XP_013981708.1 PREDICTED: protein kinase C-binding protein NELL1-like [Salmo salar]
MDIYVALLSVVLIAKPVFGFGIDPDDQIDIINELDFGNATYGITQVAGLHKNSKAFLFRDVGRAVHAPAHITEKVVQLFRSKSEFTFLASIKQKSSTSGVIFSIHESEHSYFELESSGLREEIRYHYSYKGKPRSESFPYRLADGQWHKIALSISATHLLLHVDCNRIYERVIDPPQMDLTLGSGVWLGQHSHKHGFFKGTIQDVKLIFAPNGYITQCPNLNRTCPTCSDFLSLVQGIMDLQELLAKMTLKLNYAESRLTQLEGCRCDRTCSANGVDYRDKDLWVEPENCRNCICMNGVVECRRIFCPPANCSEDSLPVHVVGTCCKKCRPKCTYMAQTLSEGQRLLTKMCTECKNGLMVRVTENCPEINCTLKEQILPDNRCCNVCKGYDFCAEGLICGENSECKNRNTRAECECKSGFSSIHGDSTYCEDIDECAVQSHYCQANTVCVNVPGSHRCDCLPAFIRVDDYSCTEHDECASGQSSCDDNAICTNTIRGHLCTCKPGYVGNGSICTAFCEEGCRSGGTCVSPNTCICPSGFTGRHCETDIDECAEGLIQCHNHSRCVNLPGWYHCECRNGFHDNGSYLIHGSSCIDVDECATQTHTCWNNSVCVNLPGGFDCMCTSGPACSGDCLHEEGLKHNGQEWNLSLDRCSLCSCKDGRTFCRRRECDCVDPEADLFCCPECDSRKSSQCLHQSGHTLYNSRDSWIYGCQQCRCLEGEVDCWPLACPVLACKYSALAEGECCPSCVTDPCLADNIAYDIMQTCQDPAGITRLSSAKWPMPGSPCTTCKCKNGSVCCSVELDCLQNN